MPIGVPVLPRFPATPARALRLGRGGASVRAVRLRLHLKRTRVAHRSEHESRLCQVPLNPARCPVVRFPQVAQLSLALPQFGTGEVVGAHRL